MLAYTNITELLNNSTSDKSTIHNYGPIYNWIFNTQYLKLQRKLNILEIGVSLFAGGGSVIPFGNAECVEKYVGVDISEYKYTDIPDNAKLYCGKEHNAYCDNMINFLKNKEGLFDIIIDDGPHKFKTQEWFLKNYSSLLNPGGILICEDIGQKNINKLLDLQKQLDLYIIDLRLISNPHRNEILAIKFI